MLVGAVEWDFGDLGFRSRLKSGEVRGVIGEVGECGDADVELLARAENSGAISY